MKRARFAKPLLIVLLAAMILVSVAAGTLYAEAAATPGASSTRQVTLSEAEATLVEQLTMIRQWIELYSPRDVTLEALYEGALAGMLEAINDPYSYYLTKEQYESLTSSLNGDYVGIGVTIDLVNGQITVINTFSGSPAEEAGIKAGDIILGVDGVDLRGRMPTEAQAVLRGEPGTEVKVILRRPSDGTTFELTVMRQLISQDDLEVRDLGEGLHYIRIPMFTKQSAREFIAVLGYLRTINIKGLILDLRNNAGGFVEPCLEIASQLVPKGTLVELRRKELKEPLESETEPESIIPVAVLVNGGTASASEILAGAIRDRGVGILIGDTTFGKASVQTLVPLANGTGLRLTIADYYTPSGYNLAGRGLDPDIRVVQEELTPPGPITYKRPMSLGHVGLDVLAMQESLKLLGYQVGEPDGIFGPQTASAVQAFLSDQHLKWNGAFGEADVERLGALVWQKVRSVPDNVLEVAISALRSKVTSGSWE